MHSRPVRSLRVLLRLLRAEGVTEYTDGALSLRFGSVPPTKSEAARAGKLPDDKRTYGQKLMDNLLPPVDD